MLKQFKIVAASLLGIFATAGVAQAQTPEPKPTIVLVHGAFAESSSWNGVISKLEVDGYKVVAAANPLRSVEGDAKYVAALVYNIKGPVVLVGHSYGGAVITNAALGMRNVKALVYVAAFLPDVGDTAVGLSNKFPGSTLGPTLAPPVKLADGGLDLYIDQDKFHAQFAADVPQDEARVMAATQRPIAQAALGEPSGEPAWKQIPSWSIYGSEDHNIPAASHAFMAARAKARRVIEVKGASHVVMVSHPDAVAKLIEEAATAK